MEITSESTTTIEKLPREMLEEVFIWLDVKSIKEASLVCKDWNDLIGSSSEIMKKFSLYVSYKMFKDENEKYDSELSELSELSDEEYIEWKHRKDESFHSHRLHHNIRISVVCCYSSESDKEESFSKFDRFDISCARELNIGVIDTEPRWNIWRFFMRTPLLESLECSMVHLDLDGATMIFPRLKSLTIEYPVCGLLRFISSSNISSFTYNSVFVVKHSPFNYFNPTPFADAEFEAFLRKSAKLKYLNLGKHPFVFLFSTSKEKFPFALESFEGGCYMYDIDLETAEAVYENFNKFLISQHLTLKHLHITRLGMIRESNYLTIFKYLRCLQKLSLSISELPENEEFYANLRPIITLKELNIDGFPSHEVATIGLFRICPNIKKLNIKRNHGDILRLVSIHCQELTELKVDSIKQPIAEGVSFNNLQSFKTKKTESVDDWLSIIIRSPVIESLSVGYARDGQITEAVIDVLLQRPTLKHLVFFIHHKDYRIIFDKMKNNYGHLKSLQLGLGCLSVKFDFPVDPAEWNIQVQEERFEHFDELLIMFEKKCE